MELLTILREGVARGASDIHLKVFSAPVFRVSGRLVRWEEAGAISREDMAVLTQSLLDDFHLQRLMGALVVVLGDPGIEPGLLLEHVGRCRFGGFLLQREMHALVAPVLLRVPGLNALNLNPEPQPPHRELTQSVDRVG